MPNAKPTPAMADLCRHVAAGHVQVWDARRLTFARQVEPSSATSWGRREFVASVTRRTYYGAINRGLVEWEPGVFPSRLRLTDAGRALVARAAGSEVPA